MIYNTPRDMAISKHALRAVNKKKKHRSAFDAKPKFVKASAFFLCLYLGTAVAFAIPLRPTYSETEKRNLKEFPVFSMQTLASGTYFDDIGTWFSDTFPFRESLTKWNTSLAGLYGIKTVAIHGSVDISDDIPDAPLEEETTAEPTTAEITTEAPTTEAQTTQAPTTEAPTEPKTTEDENTAVKTQTMGAILVAGNSGYEYYNFSSSLAKEFISCTNAIKGCTDGKVNVYSLIAPTSIDVMLNDSIRSKVSSSDQKKALDYFNSSIKNATAVTGLYETLRNHRDEYLYFRTDHHWTALGAYYCYEQLCSAKGINPVPLTQYDELRFDGFLGTFYSSSGQSSDLGNTPDTVIAYKPFNDYSMKITSTDGTSFNWPAVNDVSDYKQGSKYLTFIGGDYPYTVINNRDLPDGQTCLVIKDSYANAFTPFLIPHYKTIHIIDPRHYKGTLSDFVKAHHVDDIVFMTNISVTRNSIYIDALKEFVK